jgi:hypothetical protein
MASSRIVSRPLVPTTRSCLWTIGKTNVPVRHFFPRTPRNLPAIFGASSNIFQDLEGEFDRIHRQFDHFFRNWNTGDNQSLISRGGINGKYLFLII